MRDIQEKATDKSDEKGKGRLSPALPRQAPQAGTSGGVAVEAEGKVGVPCHESGPGRLEDVLL